MKIIIVGATETGRSLASTLSSKDFKVTLIEEDEAAAKKYASELDALVIQGDAADLSILKDAGIEDSDAIVSCTSDDKTNLMICEIARSTQVKKVISVVNSPKNEELFTKLGINLIASSVTSTVMQLKELLSEKTSQRTIAQLGSGDVQIIELVVEKGSSFVGKKAQSTHTGIVAAIYHDGDIIIPNKNTTINLGDVLILAVKKKNLKKVSKQAKGKSA